MFTVRFSHLDLRTAALALAEASRRRPRGSERVPSASLSAKLSEAFPVALARGEAPVSLTEGERSLLASSLAAVPADGYYAPRASGLRFSSPAYVAAQVAA